MEKNQGIGILLIFAVIAIYYFYTAPSEAEYQRQVEIQDSIKQEATKALEPTFVTKQETEQTLPDSIRQKNLNSTYGPFSSAMMGSSETVSIENDQLKLSFDTKGGRISVSYTHLTLPTKA